MSSPEMFEEGEIRVLFVDDEPDILEQARQYLEGENESLKVETVTSAEEGLELIDKRDFNAVVSDYMMPGMDGLEFLETLRDQGNEIPFIFLTGKGREEVAMKALNLGADRYFRKGGDPRLQYEVLSQDILKEAEREETKKALEMERKRARKYLDVAGVVIVAVDANQKVTLINDKGCDILGYEKDEVLGKNWHENFIPERVRDDVERVFKKLMAGEIESVKYTESPVLTSGGDEKILAWHNTPLRDEGGEIIGYLSSGEDITELEGAEVALWESEEQFRSVVETTSDAVISLDSEGKITFWNKAAERIYGYSADEVLGSEFTDLLPEQYHEDFQEGLDHISGEKSDFIGETIESSSIRKDGSEFPVMMTLSTWKTEKGTSFTIIVKDITEQKRAQEKLRSSEEKFRSFFEDTSVAIFINKIYGEVIEANPAAVEQTGYSRDELVGMNIADDLSVGEPVDVSLDRIKEKLREGETASFVEKKRRKDGTEYWTEVTVTPIEFESEKATLSINQDITSRKRAQKREEFLHSLLRHDLRNKIQVVQGYLELLQDYELTEEQEKFLRKSMRGSKEAVELIEKVRTLRSVEQKEEEAKPVYIGQILGNVVDRYEDQAEEEGIEMGYDECECEVLGGSLLTELFSNLVEYSISNSNCDKIRISCRESEDLCKVTVEDDGKGTPDGLKKAFNGKFKAEEMSNLGLGLSLVKRIAESYGGSVKASDSKLGGARYEIQLNKA